MVCWIAQDIHEQLAEIVWYKNYLFARDIIKIESIARNYIA